MSMDFAELQSYVKHGSLWVRRTTTCMGDCDSVPTWLALYFEGGELRAEWHCEDHVEQSFKVDPDLARFPTLILSLQPGERSTCSTRPNGPSSPLCGNPEEYLALYLAADAEDVRLGPTCSRCMQGSWIGDGMVLPRHTGLRQDPYPLSGPRIM